MQKALVAMAITAFAVAGTSACATKGYVRTQVGQVNTKVDTLSQSLEETQQRTTANEAAIKQVDTRAGAAQTAADAAGSAAAGANTAAGQANQAAQAAGQRAQAVETRVNRVIYEVVLNESQGNFAFGGSTLPDAVKARIDELISQIKADPKGAYFEIEGHTDNVGGAEINKKIGLDRAEAVKAYLYTQHQIPLHRMNVISYGEEKPAGPNNTRDGRAANRRVVIRVLG
jgi:outer membrane protein OmpA-like peptidoglycan-associated protein